MLDWSLAERASLCDLSVRSVARSVRRLTVVCNEAKEEKALANPPTLSCGAAPPRCASCAWPPQVVLATISLFCSATARSSSAPSSFSRSAVSRALASSRALGLSRWHGAGRAGRWVSITLIPPALICIRALSTHAGRGGDGQSRGQPKKAVSCRSRAGGAPRRIDRGASINERLPRLDCLMGASRAASLAGMAASTVTTFDVEPGIRASVGGVRATASRLKMSRAVRKFTFSPSVSVSRSSAAGRSA
mmetsp:Transcript_228/g.678  ORF Transcript_228/g.678 Transcript_228/m.678 type:complete len:248 (+) Transcript_228:382-1125(+)